ncbi:MAG: LysM peptidoglycan-binding domain-containing protein [Planctomycetota bacterium]
MSTLEKLLVLGVLVLVGVILSISLFWNQPGSLDPGKGNSGEITQNNNNAGSQPEITRLPVPPSLDSGSQTPVSNITNPPAGVLVAGNGPASKPAEEKPVLLARTVPSAFVTPGPTPQFYIYRVQKNDTPRSVSVKLTNTDKHAMAIDRAVESSPLVPGRDILIPAEIFANATPATNVKDQTRNHANGEIVDNSPMKTGPNVTKASAPGGELKTGPSDDATNNIKNGVAGAAESSVPGSEPVTYTVKRGDSLRKIARVMLKSEARWKEIKDMNQLKSDVIREGIKIKLPAK